MDRNGQTDLFQQIPDTVHHRHLNMSLEDILGRKRKNKTQNALVYDFFIERRDKKYTAWEVNYLLGYQEKHIVSTRRAITTLMNHDLLVKLDETKMEQEGVVNHYYRLK